MPESAVDAPPGRRADACAVPVAVPAGPPVARLEPVRGPREWDEAAARHGGTFFHRHDFLATMAEGLGFRLDLRKVVVGRRDAGVVPILYRRRGPLSVVNYLPFPSVGPLVAADDLAATMAAVARHQRLTGCVRSRHELSRTHAAAVPGFVAADESTYVVPLAGRSDEDLLQGMSSRRRAAIRRAGRRGLVVRPATMPEVTRLMPRLFAQTLARQGMRPLYPPAAFDLAWERFTGNPDVLLQAADVDGVPVAVQISLAGAPTGLAWVVGRCPDQDGSDAYAAMMWRTMCWARDRGCREFDLVGAPTEGIANYKRGLGAQERRYTVFRYEAGGYRVAREAAARWREGRHPSGEELMIG